MRSLLAAFRFAQADVLFADYQSPSQLPVGLSITTTTNNNFFLCNSNKAGPARTIPKAPKDSLPYSQPSCSILLREPARSSSMSCSVHASSSAQAPLNASMFHPDLPKDLCQIWKSTAHFCPELRSTNCPPTRITSERVLVAAHAQYGMIRRRSIRPQNDGRMPDTLVTGARLTQLKNITR